MPRPSDTPSDISLGGDILQRDSSRILTISDIFPRKSMISYVSSLSDSDPVLLQLCQLLPEDFSRTKEHLLTVLQSPQFAQGIDGLSTVLRSGADIDIGQIVAREMGYPYRGEGVAGLLRGLRDLLREEQTGQEDNQDNENQDNSNDMQE